MGTQEHWTAAQYQEYIRQRAKGGNKYHAVKAQADGRTYDSQSECKRSKAYFLYDLPDGEQMLSNGSCGYILYGHPEYTPETLRMVADLAEDDSVIMTRMPKADLPMVDQCPDVEYAAPLDTCIVAAGAVWQPLIVGAGMTFINKRALQPIEKEEEGYDLYRRGDLVVVKSGLIVQGVIRTMDLSKSEAVCRDLINLGTVAGMAFEERNNEE